MQKLYYSFYLLLIIACLSCDKSNDASKIAEEWMNKEIAIPDDLTYYVQGNRLNSIHFAQNSFKIIHYIDKKGCTKRMSLHETYVG